MTYKMDKYYANRGGYTLFHKGGEAIGFRFNACISYQPIKLKVGQRRDNAKFTSDF